MKITLIEPYLTGSHRDWAEGFATHSRHQVDCLSLKGQFWKWRMHGGAVTLAHDFMQRDEVPDLLLATDMLDVTTFLALTRERTSRIPLVLYMHENQLTYPPRPGEKRDLHYGFINYASMLCADRILFNSQYHLESWFEELPRLLKHFPDYNELHTVAELRARSSVLPVGLDLRRLDSARPEHPYDGPPLILWNHRWEYDKNPEAFFEALYALDGMGLDFRLAVLGEHFVRIPPEFERARSRLGRRIVQFGYAETADEYARWLWRSDIIVSTAWHDFFGVAVVEALYGDCFPILAKRLTYPSFVPSALHERCLFDSQAQLVQQLARAIQDIAGTRQVSLHSWATQCDWSQIIGRYDDLLAEV